MSTVFDLARAYAEHMDGWRAEPAPADEWNHEARAFLVHDGERVRLRIEQQWNTPRLAVAPVFPWRSGVSGPSSDGITVAMDRAPAAAAKDILRRAVPAVIDGTRQWEANIARAEEREARRRALRDEIAGEFPILRPWGGDEPNFEWLPGDGQRGTLKLSTHYDYDPVTGKAQEAGYRGDLDLHGLTLDQVKRVLRVLTEVR